MARALIKVLEPFKKGMKYFGETIVILINSILLSVVYIFGVGVTSLIGKFSKKKFLDKEMGKTSYWKELNLKKKEKEAYYRQF